MTDVIPAAPAEATMFAARIAIPDWPGYFADMHGQIWSRKYGYWRRIRQHQESNGGGHLHVELSRGSRASARNLQVHRLVCAAFHGRPAPRQIARHLDDDPSNNCPNNLAWGTHKDNSLDMVNHGRSLTGAKNHKAKLTDDNIREIRALRSAGESTVSLAARFSITSTNVSFICNRATWRHI